MKKVSFSLTGFILIQLLLVSCQKQLDIEIPTGGGGGGVITSKIKTYIESINGVADTFNVVYDASDRISSITHLPPGIGKFAYEYNGTTSINFKIYDGIGNTNVSIHESYYLNSNQKVDSSFQYNDTQDTSSAKFIYNQANLLTEARYYENDAAGKSILITVENYTYDAIGNRLTTVIRSAGNNIISTTTYTYNNILNNTWLVPANLPPSNKNLPLTQVETNALNVETSRLTYEYTFDAQSRVIAIKLSSSGIIVWKYFSYQ
jgi:hypothetical protein